MGSEWENTTIADISKSINTGLDAIRRAPIVNYPTNLRCLRIQDISQNKPIERWGYTETKPTDLAKYKLTKNEIIMARTCSTGICYLVEEDLPAVFNNGLARIRLDTERAYPKFIYHVFKSHQFASFIDSISGGTSVQLNMKVGDMAKYELPLPPLSEQKAIAHILGSLDDKIELNRRMNATLEGMAQALFKSWFVDFDSVIDNALAAGNPIPDELAPRAEVRRQALANGTTQQGSLDHPTLSDPKSLFPAAFQFTEELGWIPEGWDVSTIDNECEIVGGGTPSTKNSDFWDDGEFPWVTPKDFSALQDKVLLSSSRFLTQAGLNKVSSGLLPKETVLMSSRAPVGYLAISKIETAINQGFIGMTCNKRLSPEFVLQWADSRMDDIKRAAGGSTFAEISKKAFRPFEIVVPSQAIVAAYTETAGAIYDKIADGVMASNTLTKLRDTLLPKLISGELRIPEAEQLTEEAVA